MAEPPENQRRHFRIDYPEPDRPTIAFDKLKLRVIDLSEKGVKFACEGKYRPSRGMPIIAKITFKDGKTVDVTGIILRYDDAKDFCILQLNQGVPYPKMMEEQLMIIRKYQKAKG